MKLSTDVKKLYKKFIQWSNRPDKFTVYLQKEYGTWVDINSFNGVLEANSVADFVQFKKVIKESSNLIYEKVVAEYGELFEIEEVKNLKEITEEAVSNLKTERVKNIVRIVIGV